MRALLSILSVLLCLAGAAIIILMAQWLWVFFDHGGPVGPFAMWASHLAAGIIALAAGFGLLHWARRLS